MRQRVDAGEYRLLAKPFTRSDLVAEVRSLLAVEEAPELPAQPPRRLDALA
jgi:hypothetical protein